MNRQIQLHNRVVSYSIRKSNRAKRLRLAVYYDGNFVVTLPKGVRPLSAEKYIIKKSQWVLAKLDYFKNITPSKILKLTPNDYLNYRDKALELATERVKYFNKQYNFEYKDISIRNQKTRWGSCSKLKNLHFNFKILFFSKEIRDYIIVHEICHLKEQNHSEKFWRLVVRTLPNYKEIRKELNIGSLMLQ